MKAKELVTIIKRYNASWERQAILDVINYVHRMMIEHPTKLTQANGSFSDDPEFTVDPITKTLVIADASHIQKAYLSDPDIPIETLIQGNTIRFASSFASSIVKVRYYIKATALTSETKELQTPDDQVDVLEDGCIARIEMMEHGDSTKFKMWKQRDLKKYWALANINYRMDNPRSGGV